MSSYLSIVLIYVFILGQTLGPGPVSASLAALSYPTLRRGTGRLGLKEWCELAPSSACPSFPPLLAKIGLSSLTLALVPIAGLLSLWMVKWEPVGSRAEDDVIKEHEISGTEPAT
ncbi:hypothetical protein [Bradyrhizobium cenepequi]